MKPKTKFQQQVVALSKQLPPITQAQKSWGYKHCFDHFARRTKGGLITCLECGAEWQSEHRLAESICGCTCPNCNTELTIKDTRAYKFKQVEYLCVVTKFKGFQVLRFLYMEQNTTKGRPAHHYSTEVVQRWIAPNGKCATLAMLRPMFCWSDSWQWSSDLELRPDKPLYDIMPSAVYPRMVVIPEIKRNGFGGKFHALTPFEMFNAILTNNRAETLLKAKQYNLLKHFVRRKMDYVEYYWNSIRIALRNGYTIQDGSMWCDYIDLLNYFGKDVLSPKYVCPDNLKLQHDRLVVKRDERRAKERLEQERQKAIEQEERFKEQKSRFFGISFTDGVIEVRVLESVREYFEEGSAMKHCVGGYYSKENSLVLSATIDGKRIETVEVALNTMKVVQSRGVCNTNTEYHDRIINLVNKNSNLIRQRIAS